MTEQLDLATLDARNEDEGSLEPWQTRALIAEVRRLRHDYHLAHVDAVVNAQTAGDAEAALAQERLYVEALENIISEAGLGFVQADAAHLAIYGEPEETDNV